MLLFIALPANQYQLISTIMEHYKIKKFRFTDEMVSIEELRSILQEQEKMEKLLKYDPIPFLTDGITFSIREICDTEINYSDILWAEGIDARRSLLHMKNGQAYMLPFGSERLASFLSYSNELNFVPISKYNFVPIGSIERVGRKKLYLKGCDTPFRIEKIYFRDFDCCLRNYLYKQLHDETTKKEIIINLK